MPLTNMVTTVEYDDDEPLPHETFHDAYATVDDDGGLVIADTDRNVIQTIAGPRWIGFAVTKVIL